ncbi:hypothetical protein IQ264_23040 [Phormidium sp. LEGE 05292]|uniref:hypothetical protein n=1 Tax=[Phormidium] sp. LEGE 05292 TaxID=767427 RepID=UPI00187E897B|nr:hypothetical protein [Phormidium sp. LEGE 05292]MBE9228303.1 hypothetical protein [Phormidium sp. LEGE 05292]
MAYFNEFSEFLYQNSYPDVSASVNTPRGFVSGLQHFSLYGVYEGRTSASPFFNEQAYLTLYPDVRNAVASGVFKSGLEHFTFNGAQEGRYSPIGTFDSEQVYLKKYPDVAAAVKQGLFYSGYDHYLKYGQFEGRVPGWFNEQAYLVRNPDVAAAVGVANPTNGVVTFNSGFEHYLLFGQYENRFQIFSGTSGNDIVNSFGANGTNLTGVDYVALSANPVDYTLGSTTFQVDTLIGSPVSDRYLLGFGRSPSNPNPRPLYVGGGNADYALIRNFTKGSDLIQLAGSLTDYNQVVSGNNLNISTKNGNDLVAIVEGVTSPLSLAGANAVNTATGTFVIT